MSEARGLLCDTAAKVFSAVGEAADPDAAWAQVERAGLPLLLLPEDDGGFGGGWGDLFAVMRLAGERGLSLPVGEAIVANGVLAGAAVPRPGGRVALADAADGAVTADRFSGTLARVAWGRGSSHVVTEIDGRLLLLDTVAARIEHGANLAGEPRDTLRFDGATATVAAGVDLRGLGAFLRVAQSAGAMDAALAMTVAHVNTRRQFGRPLSAFQAIQQSLAVAASQAAAVDTAGQAAAAALDRGGADLELAAAKLCANAAIGRVPSILHQAHGAIGFTQDYPLHRYTRRLYAWRSEFGGDPYWSDKLGAAVSRAGPAAFWRDLTDRSDRT